MNNKLSTASHSSTICNQCINVRRLVIVLVVIFTILVVTSIILAVIAGIKPCLFIKCHVRASTCINRSLFKGQCLCDSKTAGNGRTVCDECGLTYTRPNARIIGGVDATEYSWPFAVLIQQRYKRVMIMNDKLHLVSASWLCGGTLINHKTILTAAHCLKTAGDTVLLDFNTIFSIIEQTLEVSVGIHDRRKITPRRTVKVVQAILHPSYDEKHLLNDIAILKLDDYLPSSLTVQFACLPYSLSKVNTTGTVVGFGDTYAGANQGSSTLKQVNLTVYPNDFCSDVSPTTKKNWDTQICCGDLNGERDTCQGDSGGGLYIQQNVLNISYYSIDGIVSYGEQCASPMKPGIYTRVSNYINWIQENSDFDGN